MGQITYKNPQQLKNPVFYGVSGSSQKDCLYMSLLNDALE
jgi:hypothetical protein